MNGQRLTDDSGFTLIEGIVAALILALAAGALATALTGSRAATYRAEQSQVAADIAQGEMEKVRSMPYRRLAMTGAPVASADANLPSSRVEGTSFNMDRDGSELRPLVIDTSTEENAAGEEVPVGRISPEPKSFTRGDVSGEIYRYVVWEDDPSCSEDYCEGEEDFKRVVVAVTIDETTVGGIHSYAELQSDAIDPDASVSSNPNLDELGNPTIAQQFWLTDRRCTTSDEPARTAENAGSDHATHDTRGDLCSRSNSSDALLTEAPNIDFDTGDGNDYSTDIEPPSGIADAGLQMMLPGNASCSLLPRRGSSRAADQTHIWVSRPLNLGAAYQLTGGATLKLYAQPIGESTAPGGLCVELFQRSENGSSATDTSIATKRVSIGGTGNWGNPLTVPLSFDPVTLTMASSTPRRRIGIAIGLDNGVSNQFQFLYDTLRFESRLEIETNTPITD